MGQSRKIKVSMNAPVILLFTFLCLLALCLGALTNGASNRLLFSVYRSSLKSPLTYVRLFTHVLGHSSLSHLYGNICMILVIGPLLEEKYGSSDMAFVILTTALVTGLVNFIFFPHTALLGASGVVFAMILLSSFGSFEEGTLPLTFLLVAALYLGQQLYDGIFVRDNVSNLTHIVGGGVGAFLGYRMNRKG